MTASTAQADPVLPTTRLDGRFLRVLTMCAGLAVVVAVAGLVSYLPGLQMLGSIGATLVPMAPATAVSFLFLAGILLRHARSPMTGALRMTAVALAVLVGLFGLLVVVGALIGRSLTLEERLLTGVTTTTGIAVGRMSPLTGVAFMLSGSGIALGLLQFSESHKPNRLRDVGWVLGTVTLLVGGTDLLSYVYGAPFLYAGGIVPMAATTALGFVLLGAAIVASGGPNSRPARLFLDGSTEARLVSTVVPLVAVLVLVQGAIAVWIGPMGAIGLAFEVVMVACVATVAVGLTVQAVGGRLEGLSRKVSENQTLLQTIMDSTSDPVYVKDPAGRYLVFNPAAERVTGRAAADVLGKDDFFLFPPDEAAVVMEGDRTAMSQPVPTTWEEHVTGATGETWTFLSTKGPLRAVDGSLIGLFGVARDITERVRVEARLRESEELLEQVSGLARVGGWELDLQTYVVTYSKETARIHEVDHPFVPPKLSQGDEYYPAEAWPVVRAAVQAAIEDGTPYDLETPFITAKGRHTWVRVQGVRMMHDGKAVKLRGTFQDISERKQAEEALLRSRAELAEAQRIAHVGSWTVDLDRGITEWSDEMSRIFGLQPGSPVPTREERARLYEGDADTRLTAMIAQVAANHESREVEFSINAMDGVKRQVILRGEPVDEDAGAIRHVRGTLMDVTELRRAQALLDQALRAEMIGRLAGGIAHDFNNQLAAIGGFAEVLANGIADDDPRRGDIDAIRDAALRAGALTRQLLAFGRRQVLQPSVVDPSEVIAGLGQVLRSLVPANIGLVLPTHVPTAGVQVDRAGLEQAIMNLVLNARDAMPDGGTITIGTDVLNLKAGDPRLRKLAAPGPYLQVTFADTGSGIDPALLPHVFEPFFTTKAFGLGSGLGLSTVDGFVAQSGGLISVVSEQGAGSTFSILLPVTDETLTVRQASSEPIPHAVGDETILLVEDEPAVRTITARLLRGFGYTVLEASDGTAALALGETQARIDLLLTDLVMPGLNGRQLSERLTARRPSLPTLFMSAYAPETVIGDGSLVPGVPFLLKPFTPAALASGVRELLDRSHARP